MTYGNGLHTHAMSEDGAFSAEDPRKGLIERSAYLWNTVAGLLMAFQSVIMLVVLTRVCDIVVAGVFTIAYANANLFLNVGTFGMRQFQVTDRLGQFSFREYRFSRLVTSVAMLIAGCAYLAYSSASIGYSLDKTLVVLAMCLFKLVDAVEDVFHGEYQREGRLDVGARVLTMRLATTIFVFAGLVVLLRDLLPALAVATVYTALFFAGETLYAKRRYRLPRLSGGFDKRHVAQLLKACFPLFAAAFLLFYIGNAPKYAIDAIMGDVDQAYYGFIAMPVFVVGLLASFVYNPMIASLADQWRKREVRPFLARFIRLVGAIAGITVFCVLCAWIAGVPVLNLLYNTDVSAYLGELVVLVAGGGFLAITSLATLGITILRLQRVLVWGYGAVALLALIASSWAVGSFGIAGASWTYFCTMALLACVFCTCFAIGVRKSVAKGAPPA